MLTPSQINLLRLVDRDIIYWTRREGGSPEFRINQEDLKTLQGMGLVLEIDEGCCKKEYLLTKAGQEELNARDSR